MSNPLKPDATFCVNNTQTPDITRSVADLFSLKGKTAIVTGAAAGIGLHVAYALAEQGANVAFTYHSNKDAGIQRAAEIASKYKVQCKAYSLDVTDHDAVQKLVDQMVEEFGGRLDVFVANAGIPWSQGAALGGQLSHYHDVTRVVLDGTYYSALAAGRHFLRQYQTKTTTTGQPLGPRYSGGAFVATASISGHIANIPQLQTTYNAVKAGVRQMVKSLAIEWVQFARANTISPGYIDTEISKFVPADIKEIWKGKTPMGALPSELKCAFLYFATDASSYTTGSDLIIDGGYTSV